MPKEIWIRPKPGQHVVINPEGPTKVDSARVNTTKSQARVIVAGEYEDPELAIPLGKYRATYWGNIKLEGEPHKVEIVDHAGGVWTTAGPAGLPQTNFSARYEGRFVFAAGEFEFKVTVDDGVRYSVDGTVLIDSWKQQAPTTYTARKTLTAGEHTIKIEYYQLAGEAVLTPTWRAATAPQPQPEPVPVDCDEFPPVPNPASFPHASLQAAINATAAGGTLIVPEGKVFNEEINIGKPLTIIGAGEDGIEVNGQNQRQVGIRVTANDVTLRRVNWTAVNAPIQAGALMGHGIARLSLLNCRGHHNMGGGFSISGADHRVVCGRIDHNQQNGYHAPGTERLLMKGVEIDHNDEAIQQASPPAYNGPDIGKPRRVTLKGPGTWWWPVDPLWEGGAGKIVKSDGDVFDGCKVHHNGGPGIWFDLDGNNVTIKDNWVWENDLSGIFFEISSGAHISGNKSWANGRYDDRGWGWPADVLISSSHNVDLHDNIFGMDSVTSLSCISQNRSQDFPWAGSYTELRNIYIHDNTILGNGRLTGWYDPDGGTSYTDPSNRGERNTYEGPDGNRFEWTSSTNLAGFNATRAEEGGKYLSASELAAAKAKLVAPG